MAEGSGKHYRAGITLVGFIRMFPDDAKAEAWFIEKRWPTGVCCPKCGWLSVQPGCKHRTLRFRCREKLCVKKFSVKTGTVMEGSKLGCQTWAIGMFLVSTNLKGVASMKLHRYLGITQKSAWFLAHRIRTAHSEDGSLFGGPVEVGEPYVGGKRKKRPKAKRKELKGRGPVGKTAVVGAKDRATKHVTAKVVKSTDKDALQGFVKDHADNDATVQLDEASANETIQSHHDLVKHFLLEYVKGVVHTNGIEFLWSKLKRARKGTFHNLSPKHLNHDVQEFVGCQNIREQDPIDQLASIASGMNGKRLSHKDLIKATALASGARAA